MPVQPEVLNSWKEIAGYMGRGVRTVQRWERDLRLPVHRPKGKDRSAVLAFRSELDRWLLNTPVRTGQVYEIAAGPNTDRQVTVQRARELRQRSHTLMEDVHRNAESQCAQARQLTTTLRTVLTRMTGSFASGRNGRKLSA